MAQLRPAPELQLAATVKTVDTDDDRGGFEAILSTGRLDRDGDVIAPGAFAPLPESIPIHLDHEFSTRSLVARAVPFYDGDVLKARGFFGSDADSQAVRAKVASGLIDSMSVGFHRPVYGDKTAGGRAIVGGELLEASFVSVPANSDAVVVSAKTTTTTNSSEGVSTMSETTNTTSDLAGLAAAITGDYGSTDRRHEAIDKALGGLEPAAADAIRSSILGGDDQQVPSSSLFLGDHPGEVPSAETKAGRLLDVAFTSRDFELLRQSVTGGQSVAVKAGSSAEIDMATIPDYQLPPVTFARETSRIADLIPQVSTSASTVTSYEVNAAATAAAPVAEGAAKAESSPEWAAVSHPVVKIAHWASITDEVLSDVPGFAQVLSDELIGGLVLAESDQLLNGDGTGAEMTGILANANIQAQAGAGTDIDEIAAAITKLRTVGFTEPDAVVLHPDDWVSSELALAKDTTNAYLAGRPFESQAPTIWGVPVVLTTSIASGTGLVGNFAGGARLYVRSAPSLMADPYTLATSNRTRVVAEQRLALAVLRPKAFCSVVVNTA